MSNPPVLFDSIRAGRYRIGTATLNKPERLNSLDGQMIRLLEDKLDQWRNDPDVAVVVLQARGDRAFCAGGDIRDMAEAITRNDLETATDYFAREYRLDYIIHTYPKPILAWCHGAILGGGFGLMQGASHRVVTDDAMLAMPEISIGLFPDVGAAWYLQRMPGRLGLFCGLTGLRMDSHDAVRCGLADYRIPADRHGWVIDQLSGLEFGSDPAANHDALSRLLRTQHRMEVASSLLQRAETIAGITDSRQPTVIRAALRHAADRDPWFEPCDTRVEAGSPTTFALVLEQFRRCRHLSLADVLLMDLVMALRCCRKPDFPEGVRALLIDKDRNPRWSPARLEDISPADLAAYFVPFGDEAAALALPT